MQPPDHALAYERLVAARDCSRCCPRGYSILARMGYPVKRSRSAVDTKNLQYCLGLGGQLFMPASAVREIRDLRVPGHGRPLVGARRMARREQVLEACARVVRLFVERQHHRVAKARVDLLQLLPEVSPVAT